MKAGVFVALFALLLTCAPGAKAADQYPSQRVRDIYEAPLLADPKQLWDRSSDLGRLQRQDAAENSQNQDDAAQPRGQGRNLH